MQRYCVHTRAAECGVPAQPAAQPVVAGHAASSAGVGVAPAVASAAVRPPEEPPVAANTLKLVTTK